MKKQKLTLAELKVKSFITNFENEEENKIQGGQTATCTWVTDAVNCDITAQESCQGGGGGGGQYPSQGCSNNSCGICMIE